MPTADRRRRRRRPARDGGCRYPCPSSCCSSCPLPFGWLDVDETMTESISSRRPRRARPPPLRAPARPRPPRSSVLWQFGACMSPSSLWAATVQPPAQTGMKAQSLHSFQAASASNWRAARFAARPRRGRRCARSTGARRRRSPGQAYSEPSGPIVWAWRRWISHGPMCTPSMVGKPRFFVSSRRNDIWSSSKLQLSQTLVRRAGRRHARAVERLRVSAHRRERDELGAARGGRRRDGVLAPADDRLERHLRQLIGELLLAQEIEQRRDSCRRCRRRSCRRWRCGTCRRRRGCCG